MAYNVSQLTTFFTNANAGTGPTVAQTAILQALANQNAAGGLTNDQALGQTIDLASDSTVAVSVGTYQFFLGYAPSEAGLAALNSAYVSGGAQANLNGENRFIAQSISLALSNPTAKAAFAGTYGALSVSDATALAYNVIVGNSTAAAAGINVANAVAYLSSTASQTYYTNFINANVPGLSASDLALAVKAAIVGEILFASTSYGGGAGIGSYASAETALVKDLSDDGHLANNNSAGVNIFSNYGTGAVGTTFALTANVDTIVGTGNDDTINATIDSTVGGQGTLTSLDSIDGGAGNDTLNINVLTNSGLPSGLTVKNVETVNLRAATAFTGNFSSFSGLNTLNATQGGGVALTAASATNVNVSGQTGGILVDGGNAVNVAASNQSVQVGNTTGPASNVTVTNTNLQGNLLQVNGGTNVTVTASNEASGGLIRIGNSTAPTGAVVVNSTGNAYTAGQGSFGLASIQTTGGTTVTINQVASTDLSAAAKDAATGSVFQNTVIVNGTAATTAVTVNQSTAQAQAAYVAAVAGVKGASLVTFAAVTGGTAVTVGGLTFTAAQNLTAAQVASAFANLTSGATHGSAAASLGLYSGTFSGASTGATTAVSSTSRTVTATNSASAPGVAIATTNATVTTYTPGVTAVTGVTGVEGIINGQVVINANLGGTGSSDVLKTVSLAGWGNGSSITSSALTSLALSNSASSLSVGNNLATSLSVSLANVGVAGTPAALNFGPTYTSLALSVSSASLASITAGGVTALTVSGAASVDLTGSSFGALKTVVVSGSAGVTLDASGATVTSVDTSGTTGNNTVLIDASKATFTGGAGADVVTLASTTVSKAISLGAGDDKLVLASGTTTLGATVDGGTGNNTLVMDASDAATASAGTAFASNFTNFGQLSLRAAGHGGSVNMANMNNIGYVLSDGGTNVGQNQNSAVTITRGTVEAGDTFKVIVAGTVYSYTTNGTDTGANVATQLAALINAGTTGVSATTASNVINLTSASSFSVGTSVADQGTIDASESASTSQNAITGDALTLTNFVANGTVEIDNNALNTTVSLANATGTSDVLNLVTKSINSINAGTVTAAGVEKITLNAIDAKPTTGPHTHTIALADTALNSIVITGSANVSLSYNSLKVTSIDASASTGGLTVGTSAAAVAATTVLGGAGADTLTANHNNDVLNAGAGNDTLVVNADLVTLTGGAGADVFNVAHATSNVNSYATITDLSAGDSIQFNGAAASFVAAKVALANTAVFQDYANAAIANTSQNQVAWFQYGGDTYVVEHNSANGATSFANATDIIVKVAGQVDLTGAAFSTTTHALSI